MRITGEVSDAALAAHFDAADVYVSLSVHEGFGVPLLEAMAAGVPVVALTAPGPWPRPGGRRPARCLCGRRRAPSYVAGRP